MLQGPVKEEILRREKGQRVRGIYVSKKEGREK